MKTHTNSIDKITLEINKDKDVVLSVKSNSKPKQDRLPFMMVTIGLKNRKIEKRRTTPMKVINGVEALLDMNATEAWFFKMLLKGMQQIHPVTLAHYTTVRVKIDVSKFTSSEKVMSAKAYKSLRSKDIVRRIKRGGHYCINPTVIQVDNIEHEYDFYNSLK